MKILSRSSVSFRIPHFALLISFCILHSAFCIALAAPSPSDRGDRFTDEEPIALDLAVYPHKAYFLNMDTRRARTFDYVLDDKPGTMTLKPCEIRTLPR